MYEWQKYRKRLKSIGRTIVDASRHTGIRYGRMVWFFNGYATLTKPELRKVNEYLNNPPPQFEVDMLTLRKNYLSDMLRGKYDIR